MTARIGLSVALLGLAAAPAFADWTARTGPRVIVVDENADAPAAARPAEPAADKPLIADGPGRPACPPGPHLWVEGDYLCWWMSNGPLHSPLVTTGDPTAGGLAGAIGQAGTRVLFGGNDLDYGRTSGVRLTVGGWAGTEPVGAEASVLWLDSQDVGFAARSNPAGVPPLYIPVLNLATGNEGRVIVADPVAAFAGSVAVHSRSRLWGWEANGLTAVTRGPVELTLLGGVRYLDLKESLSVQNSSADLLLGTEATMLDAFEASNRFYGGQVGGRVTANFGRWFAGLTYKVAVGAVHQTLDVSGVTVQTAVPPIPAGTFPGAVFAQPTNMGRHSSWEFAAVPELNLRAGVQIAGGLRAFVGYDVLYMSRVIRPGAELDRALNPSQSPVFGTGARDRGRPPGGPAQPDRLLRPGLHRRAGVALLTRKAHGRPAVGFRLTPSPSPASSRTAYIAPAGDANAAGRPAFCHPTFRVSVSPSSLNRHRYSPATGPRDESRSRVPRLGSYVYTPETSSLPSGPMIFRVPSAWNTHRFGFAPGGTACRRPCTLRSPTRRRATAASPSPSGAGPRGRGRRRAAGSGTWSALSPSAGPA